MAQAYAAHPAQTAGHLFYSDYDVVKTEAICLEEGYAISDEIAMLGVDKDPLVCENTPVPFSSVRHDLFGVGHEGAALLDRLMHCGKPPDEPLLIPPRSVELRASTSGFATADPLTHSVVRFFREKFPPPITLPSDPTHRTAVRDDASAGKAKPHNRRAKPRTSE